MIRKHEKDTKTVVDSSRLRELFPAGVLTALARIYAKRHGGVYLTGGTVRDLLMGRIPADIDLTVDRRARAWAADFAGKTRGTYVELGRDEDAARVVCRKVVVDFTSFRGVADHIEADLRERDVTVNAMAVDLGPLLRGELAGESGQPQEPERAQRPAPAAMPGVGGERLPVIDPVGGVEDLEKRRIRVTANHAFRDDPLRLLRVFRFCATLDFTIDDHTLDLARRQRDTLNRVAPERIRHELNLIMDSGRAFSSFGAMAGIGLLWEVVPELQAGVGMEQPASHHLDVFAHCLEALRWMERIVEDPGLFYPDQVEKLHEYLAGPRRVVQLKWAAFLHDVGKPVTLTIDEDRGGRITFYNHDQVGARICQDIGSRLRCSNEDVRVISSLVAAHMRPFHLSNVMRRDQEVSLKACLRLIRALGEHLPGLFLLGMADALAGRGDARPEEMEAELARLFARVEQVRREHVEPVRRGKPLLTGHDLIEELQLSPGPIFREILETVEEAHMEKKISTRDQALALAAALANQGTGNGAMHA
ncbi:CCA tRNA nucleotidyltransferase [Desulfolithobacter sp.]